MNISILGTGPVGQILAEKLSSLGHIVFIGTRNLNETMSRTSPDYMGRPPFREWHSNNSSIKVGSFSDAASFGEIIINALNGAGTMQSLEMAGRENLADKVLLDISNPLDFSKGMPPSLFICNTDSLAEQIQHTYPDAKVVKSLNTVNAFVMVNPRGLPEEHNIFISGNDSDSKSKVKEVLLSFGWRENEIIDLGDITSSRAVEMLLPLWVRLFGKFQNPMFNLRLVVANQ